MYISKLLKKMYEILFTDAFIRYQAMHITNPHLNVLK